jgi:hypothetical protein
MKLTGATSWRDVWPVLLVAFHYWKDVLAASCEDQGTSTPRPAFCIRQVELPLSILTFAKRFGDFGEDETCSRAISLNLWYVVPSKDMVVRMDALVWKTWSRKRGYNCGVYKSVSAQEKVLQGLRGPGSHITLQQI